ncbi:hypothetical protein AOLI_G00048560 [Acnodon oligacanthus]
MTKNSMKRIRTFRRSPPSSIGVLKRLHLRGSQRNGALSLWRGLIEQARLTSKHLLESRPHKNLMKIQRVSLPRPENSTPEALLGPACSI